MNGQTTLSTEYFLGDALGSVRQLTDASGQVTLTKAYTPYGETRSSVGSGTSIYSYTGEQTDVSGLTYLRARYYSGSTGRFLTRDTWMGNYNRPLSLNRWNYVEGNSVNYTDPSGYITEAEAGRANDIVKELKIYHVYVKVDWGMTYFQSSYMNQPGVPTCFWMEGEWQLKELERIRKGVVDLARAMGLNNFIFNLGYVNVQKGKMDQDYIATGGHHSLTVNNTRHDIGVWGTVHELGHAWDHNYGRKLSDGLVKITTEYEPHTKTNPEDCDKLQRLPGCNDIGYVYGGIPAAGAGENFTQGEDFAESVAAYVYPDDAQGKINKYRFDPLYKNFLYYADYRTTLRWQYIDALIHATNHYRPR